MANITVTLNHTVTTGETVTIKAPCNCTDVTGLKVFYPVENDGTVSQTSTVFTFRDAQSNLLTGVGNLFSKDAVIKVLLDTATNSAYIQNANTNKYLEDRFAEIHPGGGYTTTGTRTGGINGSLNEFALKWDRVGSVVTIDCYFALNNVTRESSFDIIPDTALPAQAFPGSIVLSAIAYRLSEDDYADVTDTVAARVYVIPNGSSSVISILDPNELAFVAKNPAGRFQVTYLC